MEVGKSRTSNIVLNLLSENIKDNMEKYITEVLGQNIKGFKNIEEINNSFSDKIEQFLSTLNEDELLDLRNYTGYNFKFINAILRGTWNYEEHGLLNEENKYKYMSLADRIKKILYKFPKSENNFVTYRGTTINNFKDYGISDIKDLKYLIGNYMFEQGFLSTSILEDSSYFKKPPDDGNNYNIEVRYIIPKEYNEGALLINNCLTYSISQNEFLIGKGSLSKVLNVEIDQGSNKAIITSIIVPERVYNYQEERESSFGR